jgi:hypothetical protein
MGVKGCILRIMPNRRIIVVLSEWGKGKWKDFTPLMVSSKAMNIYYTCADVVLSSTDALGFS